MRSIAKFLCSLSFCLVLANLKAQEVFNQQQRFTYGLEAAQFYTLTSPFNNDVFNGSYLKLNLGYNQSPNLYFGVSAGYNHYNNHSYLSTLPLEVEVKSNLLQRLATPVAFIKGGYSFKILGIENSGFTYSGGIGYRFKMGDRARFSPFIGYCYQGVHAHTTVANEKPAFEKIEVKDPVRSVFFAVRFEF